MHAKDHVILHEIYQNRRTIQMNVVYYIDLRKYLLKIFKNFFKFVVICHSSHGKNAKSVNFKF